MYARIKSLLEHVIDGVTYPYVFVNLDRYSGEALVLATTQPQIGEPAKGLFTGTCTRQSRQF